MATKTEKYGLTKPDVNDYYDIGVFNENMDVIEREMAEHEENKNNPHSVTAAQVRALPIGGGTLTGELTVKSSGWSRILLKPTTEDRTDYAYLMLGPNKVELRANNGDANGTSRSLILYNSAVYPDIRTALELFDKSEDNVTSYHKIFGEHNKPTGMYTGNGSVTTRMIYTGGVGRLLFLYDEIGFGFVTPGGALFFRGTSATRLEETAISYNNGTLTINSNNSAFNGSGCNYEYDCL